MNEKIKVKMEDKEFAKAALACKDEQEITELFAKEGIEVTCEDLRDLGDVINSVTAGTKELSEDDLEHVSGGVGSIGAPEGSEGIAALINNIAVDSQVLKAPTWWNPNPDLDDTRRYVCAYGVLPPSPTIKDWTKQLQESEDLE